MNAPVTDEVITVFDEACRHLNEILASAATYPPKRRTAENDLALAVVLHALSARDDARAVSVLARASVSHPLITHIRTIFEARTKMIWLTKDPIRATRFFDSEPFERYRLARKYPGIKQRAVWKTLLADCKQAVKDNPRLLNHQTSGALKQTRRPDYMAISLALRMPEMEELLEQIEATANSYTEDFALSSLSAHVSIVHLKEFPKKLNADGSMTLDTSASLEFTDGYVLKGVPWLLEIALMASVALGTDETAKRTLDAFAEGSVRPVILRYKERFRPKAS